MDRDQPFLEQLLMRQEILQRELKRYVSFSEIIAQFMVDQTEDEKTGG
jgi:hypothetical protein